MKEICEGCRQEIEGRGTLVAGRGLMHNRCAKIGKAHATTVRMVTCQNCFELKPEGSTCFQCGVSDRVG